MIDARKELNSLADVKYREFQKKIVPCDDEIIGVRMPQIKALAAKIIKDDCISFIESFDAVYYEEKLLKGLVIAKSKLCFDERIGYLKAFVPIINNWAVCDCVCSALKCFDREQKRAWEFITPYLDSNNEFEIRFALVSMLSHFVNDEYIDRVLYECGRVQHDGYYVKMAAAWLISVCMVKYKDKTLEFMQNCAIDDFTFNKAISKCCDSYRISSELKQQLKSMRR